MSQPTPPCSLLQLSWPAVTNSPHLCFSLIYDGNCSCENSPSSHPSSFLICGDGSCFCGDCLFPRPSSFLICGDGNCFFGGGDCLPPHLSTCGDGNAFCGGDCLSLHLCYSWSFLICGDAGDCRYRNRVCAYPSLSCNGAPPPTEPFDCC